MRLHWKIAVLGVAALLAGCKTSHVPPGATVSIAENGQGGASAGVTRGIGIDDTRPIGDTWEEAALVEARRAAPWIAAPAAVRVHPGPGIERVQVNAAGYCHLFGGLYDGRIGWQANDLVSVEQFTCGPEAIRHSLTAW